jgi:predicted ATPase
MRLDKLEIAEFKNLREFSIDFDEDSFSTVIVGRNGTGKSNLLEALVIAFRDLDLGAPPAFKYQLDYSCRGYHVHVDCDPTRARDATKVSVNGEGIAYSQVWQASSRMYLPRFVFGYYSGPTNRMETHFEQHQERFYRDLLKGVERPLRPLFYARPVHSQFVLLSFFTEHDPATLEFLREHLWIEGLDSVLFVMRQPPWSGKDGDPRFWNARGTVQRLLSELYGLALAPLRISQRVQLEFRKTATKEHLYLYLRDAEHLKKLASVFPSQQDFFKALESTYISKLISEVRINVKVRTAGGSLTFRELSEGEQQLLMVLGLLRFTREQESLFLLDEPDTHLNPAWSLQYLEFLKKVVGDQPTSHVIMTTHDPLTIAGLLRSQVQVVQRDEETGRLSAGYPEQDPRGMGIAALLTSDVYGLRSQLDIQTLELLDQKRKLATKEVLSEQERAELHELNAKLAGLDFTNVVRDPLYERFVKAMSDAEGKEGLLSPVLSEEQRKRRDKLAREIIQGLRDTETKDSEND